MSKKILISLSVIGVVAAIVIGATTAYFSDTETSTGNTFTAGAIDLTIDNESYVTGSDGELVYSENTSWELDDLTDQLFFNFSDLKPGDIGEDTISLHVDSNDAWVCLAIEMTENSDNTCTEPELELEGNNCVEYVDIEPNTHFTGELAENLQIAVWADDGDNVYETHERLLQLGGVGNPPIVTLQELAGLSEEVGPIGVLTLADSQYSVFTTDNSGKPLVGDGEYHLAKAWCFGDLTMTALDQGTTGPLDRSGFANCDGKDVNNASQTDRVMGNITFYAEQARNNDGFTCAAWGRQ